MTFDMDDRITDGGTEGFTIGALQGIAVSWFHVSMAYDTIISDTCSGCTSP